MKKWLASLFIIGVFVGPYLNPFSIFKDMNEFKAISHVIGKDERYKGEKVLEVDYLGEGAYLVTTETKEYIMLENYTSVMNGEWIIYEEHERGFNY